MEFPTAKQAAEISKQKNATEDFMEKSIKMHLAGQIKREAETGGACIKIRPKAINKTVIDYLKSMGYTVQFKETPFQPNGDHWEISWKPEGEDYVEWSVATDAE